MNTTTKNAPGGVGAPAEGIEPTNQIVTTTTAEGVLTVTILPTLLASRLASASQHFPMPDGARVYVRSEGARLYVVVTERDARTRQETTREFIATVTEVA